MNSNRCHETRVPATVSASLEARLSPFPALKPAALEDLDVEASRAVSPRDDRRLRLGLVRELKLLFAALGAGTNVVPMGDNGRTTRMLSEYARSLQSRN